MITKKRLHYLNADYIISILFSIFDKRKLSKVKFGQVLTSRKLITVGEFPAKMISINRFNYKFRLNSLVKSDNINENQLLSIEALHYYFPLSVPSFIL
jgi:hypothetical protein